MKHKTIHNMIDQFLKERKKSDGGWAPVDNNELVALTKIFEKLIGAKYQKDPDGDLPIQGLFIDLTTCETMHFKPMPHTHAKQGEDEQGPEVIQRRVIRHEWALFNLMVAADQFRASANFALEVLTELGATATEAITEIKKMEQNPVDRVG